MMCDVSRPPTITVGWRASGSGDMKPSDIKKRAASFESQDEGGSLQSLLDGAVSGGASTFDLAAAPAIVQQQFVVLSADKKADALARLVAAIAYQRQSRGRWARDTCQL